MIKFNKTVKKTEIVYTFEGVTITCRKNPKWEISLSDINGIDTFSLIEMLTRIFNDINTNEVICLSIDNNLDEAIDFITKINNIYKNNGLIFKVREEKIENIAKHIEDIKLYHLPIIINYIIPSDETDLENNLQLLKSLDELYCLDDLIQSRFRLYSRKINKIYLTKKLELGMCDDPFSRATFMYYLDRFGFKTTFEGEQDLVETWQQDIRKYYENAYFISKKRNLKVVQ